MVPVFTIQSGGVKESPCSFFDMDPVLEFVAFRLTGIPVEHLLCIYNIQERLKDALMAGEVSGVYRRGATVDQRQREG